MLSNWKSRPRALCLSARLLSPERWHDQEHGARAADYEQSLHGSVFKLPTDDLAVLVEACLGHTLGRYSDNVTV